MDRPSGGLAPKIMVGRTGTKQPSRLSGAKATSTPSTTPAGSSTGSSTGSSGSSGSSRPSGSLASSRPSGSSGSSGLAGRFSSATKKFQSVAKAIAVTTKREPRADGDRPERVMYGRSQRGMHVRTPVVGGTPITDKQALLLRQVVFGDAATPPRSEWSRTGLVMREPERDLAYGLRAPRNGTRGLLAVVQAYLVKHLLFEPPPGLEGAGPPTARAEELLRPSRARQYEALWAVVSAILWKVGEQQRVVVAVPQEKNHVPHSQTYFQDGVTEKLHLFEFTTLQDLQIFMKQYLYLFTDDPGPGCLLLLYSAVLTRGCDKVRADLEDDKACLVTTAEEGPQTIVTLLMVGRATPYLHNGIVYVGDEDHYAVPQYGVLNRSDVGYLVWDDTGDSDLDESSRQPGSRLKTPSLPVWVVNCSGYYGVVFNTNRELLRNYHAERRFELLYYTAGAGQWCLTVDTRFHESEGGGTSKPAASREASRPKDDFTTTAQALCLEKVIHTKWQDAHVTWNSMIPGV